MLKTIPGFPRTIAGFEIIGQEGMYGTRGNSMYIYRFIACKDDKSFGLLYNPEKYTRRAALKDFTKAAKQAWKEAG